jgi:flagellar basal body-associated protein FliL
MNLSPRLKKILIIIGFIILVVVLAWLIYFFFFRSATPTPITGTTTSGGSLSGGLPTVSEGDSGVVTGATESTNNQLPVIGAQTGYVKDVTTVATGNIWD